MRLWLWLLWPWLWPSVCCRCVCKGACNVCACWWIACCVVFRKQFDCGSGFPCWVSLLSALGSGLLSSSFPVINLWFRAPFCHVSLLSVCGSELITFSKFLCCPQLAVAGGCFGANSQWCSGPVVPCGSMFCAVS